MRNAGAQLFSLENHIQYIIESSESEKKLKIKNGKFSYVFDVEIYNYFKTNKFAYFNDFLRIHIFVLLSPNIVINNAIVSTSDIFLNFLQPQKDFFFISVSIPLNEYRKKWGWDERIFNFSDIFFMYHTLHIWTALIKGLKM